MKNWCGKISPVGCPLNSASIDSQDLVNIPQNFVSKMFNSAYMGGDE
jgi:hypothetical protein